MERQGLYYAVFRLEKPGFKPVTLQGLYEPSGRMTNPEMRIELYQAVHEFVKERLKTERFKLSLTGLTRMKTDFVYTPGRTAVDRTENQTVSETAGKTDGNRQNPEQ